MISNISAKLIFIWIIFLPSETLLISFLPVSESVELALSQAIDLSLLILLIISVFDNYLKENLFFRGKFKIGVPLLVFLAVVFANMVLREAEPMIVIVNVKALLRYLMLVYLVLNLKLHNHLEFFLKGIYISLAIQVVIGLLQLMLGPSFSGIFVVADEGLRAELDINFTAGKESQKGFISGTFQRSLEFSYFVLFGFFMVLVQGKPSLRTAILMVILLTLIFYSGSRASFAFSFLGLSFYCFKYTDVSKKISIALAIIPLLTPFWVFVGSNIFNSYFGEMFTTAYVENAREQRLGILVDLLPWFFSSEFNDVLFGFTPDRDILTQRINEMPTGLKLLRKSVAPIEDVYWVALLYYYGVLGFFLICLIVVKTWAMLSLGVREIDQSKRQIARLCQICLLSLIFLNLFNQAFEVKHFNFLFWLLSGVTASAVFDRKKSNLTFSKRRSFIKHNGGAIL